jgi:antitoxin PrlF
MPKAGQLMRSAPSVRTEYRGKRTKTGNSSGFRFEGALFRSHPEFSGEVKARVIAPGRMLVIAEGRNQESNDPVLESFLAFIAKDIEHRPEKIGRLSMGRAKRIVQLTKGMKVNPDEDLGDEISL